MQNAKTPWASQFSVVQVQKFTVQPLPQTRTFSKVVQKQKKSDQHNSTYESI
jgi:hypothetical protein